jgi:MFS family permease
VGVHKYPFLVVAAGGVVLLAVSFVLAGVGIGCAETAEHAAVASLAPERYRGSAFGLLAAIQSFGNLAASGVAGLLWTALSLGVAFTDLAAWMLVAFVGLVGLFASRRRPGK